MLDLILLCSSFLQRGVLVSYCIFFGQLLAQLLQYYDQLLYLSYCFELPPRVSSMMAYSNFLSYTCYYYNHFIQISKLILLNATIELKISCFLALSCAKSELSCASSCLSDEVQVTRLLKSVLEVMEEQVTEMDFTSFLTLTYAKCLQLMKYEKPIIHLTMNKRPLEAIFQSQLNNLTIKLQASYALFKVQYYTLRSLDPSQQRSVSFHPFAQ